MCNIYGQSCMSSAGWLFHSHIRVKMYSRICHIWTIYKYFLSHFIQQSSSQPHAAAFYFFALCCHLPFAILTRWSDTVQGSSADSENKTSSDPVRQNEYLSFLESQWCFGNQLWQQTDPLFLRPCHPSVILQYQNYCSWWWLWPQLGQFSATHYNINLK